MLNNHKSAMFSCSEWKQLFYNTFLFLTFFSRLYLRLFQGVCIEGGSGGWRQGCLEKEDPE